LLQAIVKNIHDLLAKLAWDFSAEQLDHLFECFQVGLAASSIADPGCLSRILIFIPDPDFYPARIMDLGSQKRNKRVVKKKNCCHTFFCSHKFHKSVNYFIFLMLKKKIWANFQRIIELLPKKLSLSSQKYEFGIRDPRSGIRDPEKNLFRIPDPDPQHWSLQVF
jgi:hypothetical protein